MWKLFHDAVERDECERDAFLERGCAGDRALRRRVEELLAAHESDDDVLDRPALLTRGEEVGGSESVTFEPGEVLAGRFEIVRLLGEGGMGMVYAAFDRELNTTIALKILRTEIARVYAPLDRFRAEISLARRVTHPNVCRIFDLFRHDEATIFLTMELLIGETLADRVLRRGPMATGQALPIIEQIVAALSAAHRVGVVHRDLNGKNVMLVAEDEETRAVVTDFGLATTSFRDTQGIESTRSGLLLGTPAFMAPEQLANGPISPGTDVYALGLVIYQMLTGRLPIEGGSLREIASRRLHREVPSPREFVPDLDPRWERTILGCLERSPTDRFQKPAEVLERLKRAGP